MSKFWRKKRVLITGGTGFIGSFVAQRLLTLGSEVSVTYISKNLENIYHIRRDLKLIKADLTNIADCRRASKKQDVVLNLASRVAGIQYNVDHPVEMFDDNIKIARNMIEASFKNNVERFLVVSSACVYARNSSTPTPENEGFLDDPEPTNLGYGWAKRVAELLGRFYFQEYNFKVAIARPYNAYGPRDNFDPKISHVIPGIIKRVFDGENPLVVWGSGKQTRSFIYVEDFVRGLIEITEKYPVADPVNIGTKEEISIGKLAELIIKISGKNTTIKFEQTKPDGQPRRVCDVSKAKTEIDFEAKVTLKEGLKKTIEWYKRRL